MAWLVYILRTNEGTLYTGITKDMDKRLERHRKGKGAKYLRRFSDFELVYKENMRSRGEALSRESAIKRLPKPQKEALVASFWLT